MLMRILIILALLSGCAPSYNTTTTGDKLIIGGAIAAMVLWAGNIVK